jgi:hypothetical protein
VAGSADLPLSNPVTMLFWRAVLAMVLVLDCVSWTACGISMEQCLPELPHIRVLFTVRAPAPSPVVCVTPEHSCPRTSSGDRERLDTSPWMAVTVLPRRRSCTGETRVAPGRILGTQSHVWLRGGPIGSCVHPPVPGRLHCHGVWAECDGGVRVQSNARAANHGDAAHRAGHDYFVEIAVCAPPLVPLDACAVTGSWAECGGVEACAGS